MSVTDDFHVYDTTLRDGTQQEGLSLAVADKLAIARHLDALGVGFIEGGWPGAVPKDTEFFRRARTELDLKPAQLAAFVATLPAGAKAPAAYSTADRPLAQRTYMSARRCRSDWKLPMLRPNCRRSPA